jgi:hypothetical protein
LKIAPRFQHIVSLSFNDVTADPVHMSSLTGTSTADGGASATALHGWGAKNAVTPTSSGFNYSYTPDRRLDVASRVMYRPGVFTPNTDYRVGGSSSRTVAPTAPSSTKSTRHPTH